MFLEEVHRETCQQCHQPVVRVLPECPGGSAVHDICPVPALRLVRRVSPSDGGIDQGATQENAQEVSQ